MIFGHRMAYSEGQIEIETFNGGKNELNGFKNEKNNVSGIALVFCISRRHKHLNGARWSWDHDGDGLGDGDGDGIGDWEGAVMFMRLQHPGNSTPGLHTFEIRVTNDGGLTFDDIDVVTFLVE